MPILPTAIWSTGAVGPPSGAARRGEPRRAARAAVSVLAACAVLIQGIATPAVARKMTRAEYEACQTRDEASFKAAIEGLTLRALQEGLKSFDYPAAVGDEWRKLGFDEVLDKRVDAAVADVSNETSLWERSRTLFDKEKAQALAVSVAERVYRSDEVKAGIEGMTNGVARSVGATILLAASDAAEPALECLETFLGPRYGSMVAGAVAVDARKEFHLDPAKAGSLSTGSVLSEGSGSLAGVVILAVRRQLATIATRVSQRIVGSLLGRLVSVVAGGIGAILIAKDIWEFRNGVLPIVATEMKARSTKDMVRTELAKAISEQINEHNRDIAAASADRVIEIWRDFRRGHAKVIELAERNADFRAFVDTLKPADLARLDEIVALLLATESENGVLRRLKDGTLVHAVTKMTPGAIEIAREKKSLDEGIRWASLAGPQLPLVVELGLFRRSSSADFTPESLKRVLALEDRGAIGKLTQIGKGARDALLELPDRDLRNLARSITELELETLASYLTSLSPPARDRVLKAVAATPSRMQPLGAARVRDAILSSRDQLAAVSMMLRADTGFDAAAIKEDLGLVYNGQVSPILLWDKHPASLGGGAAALLLLLLVMRRLLFGRRSNRAAA